MVLCPLCACVCVWGGVGGGGHGFCDNVAEVVAFATGWGVNCSYCAMISGQQLGMHCCV